MKKNIKVILYIQMYIITNNLKIIKFIIYGNKIFKHNSKQIKYYKDKGKNIETFKCKNARKNERESKAPNLGEFCSERIREKLNIYNTIFNFYKIYEKFY